MDIEISSIIINSKKNIVHIITPDRRMSDVDVTLSLDYGFDTILYYDILDNVIEYIKDKPMCDGDIDRLLTIIPQLKIYFI